MIHELNEKNLTELGFNTEQIKGYLESENTYTNIVNNKGSFYIDNKEGKIYTDTDKNKHLLLKQGLKIFPFSFPELIPEYFDTHLRPFFEEKARSSTTLNKEQQTKVFINRQIKETKERIQSLQTFIDDKNKFLDDNNKREWTSKKKAIEACEEYLLFLENKTIELEQPQQEKQDVLIDYSGSKITEKIIALNEAGVLDFLKTKQPFDMAVNSLANFLSLCTGEKAVSIQPCLNAMHKKGNAQKNNPYNTPKTVEKTKAKLIQIGLKIE